MKAILSRISLLAALLPASCALPARVSIQPESPLLPVTFEGGKLKQWALSAALAMAARAVENSAK